MIAALQALAIPAALRIPRTTYTCMFFSQKQIRSILGLSVLYITMESKPFLCLSSLPIFPGLFHTPKAIGRVTINKGDRFFTLHGDSNDEALLFPGDIVKGESFVSRNKEVDHDHNLPTLYFVRTDNAATVSSGKRTLVCFMEQLVRARGRVVTIAKKDMKVHKPVTVNYYSSKQTLDITVHSLNINASRFLTTDGIAAL